MAHTQACPRVPVRRLMAYDENGILDYSSRKNHLPFRFVEQLEQNQQIASCCRHPENHEIEAFYSCDEARDQDHPDIYILHCTCGRQHRRFMCGQDDVRPIWR